MRLITDNKTIRALQGLRACAFIGVFLNHSIGGTACLGAAGVSIFFVLSGFLMAFTYWDRDAVIGEQGLAGSFKFAWKKIWKLYPLHVFMMILVITYAEVVWGYQKTMTPQLLGEALLNAALLQAWIPISEVYFSLNAVSWYLSTALFCYFMFSLLLCKLKKQCSVKRLLSAAAILAVLMCAISSLAAIIGSPQDKAWFSQHWITYVFPVSRLLDFSLGAIAGSMFMLKVKAASCNSGDCSEKGRNGDRFAWTAFELFAALLFAGAVVLFKHTPNWIRYSVLYIVPSLGIVFTLSMERGLLSRILSLAPFRYIGGISGYAFLIHWFAIRITVLILRRLFPDIKTCFIVFTAFAVTIIASEIVKRTMAQIDRLRNNLRNKKGPSNHITKETES